MPGADQQAPFTAMRSFPEWTLPRQRNAGPKHRGHERFAQEVAKLLSDGIAADRCDSLLLVASNPFLGELKSHLSAQATKAIVRTVPSDYTLLRESELGPRLQR